MINNIIYIIAFLIGYILMKFYNKNKIEHGPDSNDIKKTIFEHNGEFYKFTPYPVICPIY